MTAQDDALEMMRGVERDGCAEINGREYKLLKINHRKRLRIFSYSTMVGDKMQNQDFSFLGTDEWEVIEKLICDHVEFEGGILSKSLDHWDKYQGDYMQFIMVFMGVFSLPFMNANPTD